MRGRELITGVGGAARASHAYNYVTRHCTSSFGRHGNNSTSCAASRSRLLPSTEQISCLLSGIDRRHNPCHVIRRRAFSSTVSGAINNNRNQRLIDETQNWLDRIVIGQKLCPFAPPVRSPPRLRMVASEATDADQLVEHISAEADLLVAGLLSQNGDGDDGDNSNADTDDDGGISLPPQPSTFPETTLVILNTRIFPAMSDYRNLIRLSWRIQLDCIVNRGHSDHLQLVLFHPLAVHDTYTEQPPGDDDDDDDDDCANYTIRSPHPTIHLLRQADVMRAARGGYADLECLPSRNKARLRGDGLEACRQRLEECSSSL